MTADINDLDLNAYLDGELDDDTRKRLETALADDPEAQRRLRDLRAQNTMVRAAMSEPMRQPLPDHVHTQVKTMLAHAARTRSGSHPDRGRTFFPAAMAASIVIALAGVVTAFVLLEQRVDRRLAELEPRDPGDQVHYENALTVALEQHISGQAVVWVNPDTGASGSITPVRTFKAATDDWCREFNTVASKDGVSKLQSGIACRTEDGVWQTRVLVFEPPDTVGPDL